MTLGIDVLTPSPGDTPAKEFTIIVLEDNQDDIYLLKDIITRLDPVEFQGACRFVYIDSLQPALEYIDTQVVDLVLLDLFLSDSRGLDTLKIIRERIPDVPVIVLTVLDDKSTSINAVKMGAQEYLVKSDLDGNLLLKSIHYAVERQQLQLQLEKETQELQQRESQLMRIINGDPDGLIIVETESDNVLFLNPAAEKLLGRKSEQLINKPFGFKVEVDLPMEIAVLRDTQEKTSQNVYADMRAVEIDWRGKKAWLVSLRDMTAKKMLLEAYEEEKERLDVALRSIADGVIATDEQGMTGIINWVACQMTGLEHDDAVGRPLDEILNLVNNTNGEIFRFSRVKAMPGKTVQHSSRIDEWILTADDGTQIPIEYSCGPIRHSNREQGIVMVIRDVSETKTMEEEAARVQNLEALGLLAGGIAHEYNNLLTSVIGFLSLARLHTKDNERLGKRLKKAEEAGLRAKEISGRLLTFSKGGEPRKKKAAIIKTLNDAVIDTINDPSITVGWQLEQLWTVVFDPDQINLALKNILANALDAMPGGGTIRVKAENVNIKKDQPGGEPGTGTIPDDGALPPAIAKGRYVRVSISDQGEGIAREHLSSIFMPYFSTKTKAEGMGLTTAYSIIKKHGGYVSVESRVSAGSTLMIWLPAMGGADNGKPAPPSRRAVPGETAEAQPGPADQTGTRKPGLRVLVMDDELYIRDIAGEMLTELGHKPETAENGEEAIRLYRDAVAAGQPFDAVILDLTVPSGMGGKDCMEILSEIEPGIKAIVSSGYSNDPIIANYTGYGFSGVLPKPYELRELEEALKKIF